MSLKAFHRRTAGSNLDSMKNYGFTTDQVHLLHERVRFTTPELENGFRHVFGDEFVKIEFFSEILDNIYWDAKDYFDTAVCSWRGDQLFSVVAQTAMLNQFPSSGRKNYLLTIIEFLIDKRAEEVTRMSKLVLDKNDIHQKIASGWILQ